MPRGNQTTMDRLSAMAGQVLEGKVLGEAAKADPKAMQTGPRGGKYYLDSRGRKVYGEPDGTSGGRGDNEPDDGAKSAPRAIADQIRAAGGDDVRGVIPKPDGSLVAVLKSGGMIAIRPDNNGTAVHALSPGFGAKWTQIGSAIPKGSRMADIDIKAAIKTASGQPARQPAPEKPTAPMGDAEFRKQVDQNGPAFLAVHPKQLARLSDDQLHALQQQVAKLPHDYDPKGPQGSLRAEFARRGIALSGAGAAGISGKDRR